MLRLVRSAERVAAPARVQAEDPLRTVAPAAARGDRNAQRTLLVAVGPACLRAIRGVLGSAPGEVEDTLQEALVALARDYRIYPLPESGDVSIGANGELSFVNCVVDPHASMPG